MNKILIFRDRRGRRWVCGYTLRLLFGIVETGVKKFWNYDWLCKVYQRSDKHERH